MIAKLFHERIPINLAALLLLNAFNNLFEA